VVIQKCFRGFSARLDLAVQWAAAQTIQAAWRSAATRLRFGVTVHRIILVQVPRLFCPSQSPATLKRPLLTLRWVVRDTNVCARVRHLRHSSLCSYSHRMQ